MAAPDPRYYVHGTSTEIETDSPLEFTWTGVATEEQLVDVVNDIDGLVGADDLVDHRFKVLVRDPGESGFVAGGREAVDRRYATVRIVEGIGALAGVAVSSATVPLGSYAYLECPKMPAQAGVTIGIAIDAHSDTEDDDLEFLLDLKRASEPLPVGFTESMPDGIISGLCDDAVSVLHSIGDPAGVVENPGGADDNVQVPECAWISTGVPLASPEQLVEIDDQDVNSDALASGESYYALLYLGYQSAEEFGVDIQIAKGEKFSGAGSAADYPALPDQWSVPLARVLRQFDGIINDADITQLWTLGASGGRVVSGLQVGIGKGDTKVDNAIVSKQVEDLITLPDDSTGTIYRLRSGGLTTTWEARAAALYNFETISGVVTQPLDDVREFVGYRSVDLRFDLSAALATDLEVIVPGIGPRWMYLRAVESVLVWLKDLGTPSGGTPLIFDILYAPPPTFTFASIFGDADRMPSFAHNGGVFLHKTSHPTKRQIPPFSLLKFKVADYGWTGGSPPAGACAVLRLGEA